MSDIFGCLACQECSHQNNEQEILGAVDGQIITIPTALRDVIVVEGKWYTLACGHQVHQPMFFHHPEEWLGNMRAPRMSEPLSAELLG